MFKEYLSYFISNFFGLLFSTEIVPRFKSFIITIVSSIKSTTYISTRIDIEIFSVTFRSPLFRFISCYNTPSFNLKTYAFCLFWKFKFNLCHNINILIVQGYRKYFQSPLILLCRILGNNYIHHFHLFLQIRNKHIYLSIYKYI